MAKATGNQKKATPAEEEKHTALAVAGVGALPATIDEDELQGLEGLGYSELAEDSLIPILSILQDNSAEAKRQHSRYVQGALPGDLIIRSSKRLIHVDADQPLVVQPCGFQHTWVRWLGEPGEGRVLAQYPYEDRPEEAVQKRLQEDDERETWVMPDGSRLVDTRYHYCQAQLDGRWSPIVIPFAGTNHTVSRTWTNIMKEMRLPSGQRAPAWFRAYGFVTKYNERGTQSWYTYDFRDLGWIGEKAVRDDGRALFESVSESRVTADVRSEDQSGAREGAEDGIPI